MRGGKKGLKGRKSFVSQKEETPAEGILAAEKKKGISE